MAKRNSTDPLVAHAQNGKSPIDSIIRMMEYNIEGFLEQMNEVQALATGGEAWAGKIGHDGNEIDITSRLMFGVIRGKVEDASSYYALKDAIAELRARLTPEAAKGAA